MSLSFVERLECKRKGNPSAIKQMSLEQVRGRIWASNTLFELLKSPCNVKPYFDAEVYLSSEAKSDVLAGLQTRMKAHIARMFVGQPATSPTPDVVTATRHGVDPRHPGKFKASFRAWVPNYSVEYSLLPDIISTTGGALIAAPNLLPPDVKFEFDLSVYKPTEQLLGCVGCAKSATDRRVLTPSDPDEPLASFIVQHLAGDEAAYVWKPDVEEGGESAGVVRTMEETQRAALVVDHPVNRLGSLASAEAIVKYLECLSKSRWDQRRDWVALATILKNEGGDRLKEVWLRFSRLSPKFDADDAELVWSTVARPDYTGPRLKLRTLIKWAREDDPHGADAVRAAHVPLAYLDRFRKEDRGLAEIAFMVLGHRVKRCLNTFYVFDDVRNCWTRGQKDAVLNPLSYALEGVLEDIQTHYAVKQKDLEARAPNAKDGMDAYQVLIDAAAKSTKRVLQKQGVSAVLDMVAPMFRDDGFEQQLDSVPHLLGVRNGVVDLRTGALRTREPEDLIYTIVNVDYDPDASTALIHETVRTIMAGDEEMARFMQKLLGYGITGEVCEEVFVVFTGTGRNGKGVITQLLANILGNFFKELNNAIICERKVSNLEAERGALLGTRIASFKELEPGERLKTSEVQLLSGGDGISARPLYKDPMVVTPHHLCILETNHMPEMDVVIPAIANRVVCVNFPVTFEDLRGREPTPELRQVDTTLKSRLRAEHAGVLTWLVQGAVTWYAERGLRAGAPAKVTTFTKAYLAEQDVFLQFLDESCERGAADKKASSAELLNAYNDWANARGDRKLWGSKKLAAAMRLKGFENKQVRVHGDRVYGFEGIALKATPPAFVSDP